MTTATTSPNADRRRWEVQVRDPESPYPACRKWVRVGQYPTQAHAKSAMTFERGRFRTHTTQLRVVEVAYDDRGFWKTVEEGVDAGA